MKLHKDLSKKHWYQLSIFDQLANVGSEIFRTISWRKKDKKLSKAAFERGLELLDLTISDPKNKKRLKELCRAREILIDYFIYDNQYNSTDKFWNDYFYVFNYAARVNH
jgi:hypothetical protein